MSISATRSTPQQIESLLKFKQRPEIIDSKALASLSDNDVVTAGPVKSLNNEITLLSEKIPPAPSEDGSYRLDCTVSGSSTIYSWEALS